MRVWGCKYIIYISKKKQQLKLHFKGVAKIFIEYILRLITNIVVTLLLFKKLVYIMLPALYLIKQHTDFCWLI